MASLRFIAALAFALAACGEEPQVLDAAREPGFRTDGWPDQLRERTLTQNEANRIDY